MLLANQLNFERFFEPVFEPASFELGGGGLLLVTGVNGCGKTTLIRVLAGILHPSSGKLENGFDSMAYVGHHLAIKDDLSVLENLRFMRGFTGSARRSCRDVVDELGLSRVRGQLARTLSAGQRKRCALGRLLLGDYGLWLLDEPYSNLDTEGVERVDALLGRHLEAGGACVLATHGAHRPTWENTIDYHLLPGARA